MRRVNGSLIISLMIFLMSFSVAAWANNNAQKTELKVLYVGYNPNTDRPVLNIFRDDNTDQAKLDFKTRMPAFKQLLEKYFTKVSCVDARDYKPEISVQYDVTIIDELTNPIREEIRIKDENGVITKYEPAAYFPDNYDRATIFIGKVAPNMGASLGSKLDWR